MIDWGLALRALLVWGALVGLAWLLISVVRNVKRGGKGMQAIGAALMLFGWGNLRDPRDNPVAEAQEGRKNRGSHAGDPRDPDPQ